MPVKSTLCFLKTYTEVSPAGTQTESFTYSESRPATWIKTFPSGETITSTFEYHPPGLLGGLVKRLNIEHGAGSGRIDYFYDSLKRLSMEDAVTAPSTYKIRYTYNHNSQLSHSYLVVGNDTTQVSTFRYPDIVTDNPDSITLVSNGVTVTHLYTYDDKINPMRGMLPSIYVVSNPLTHAISGGSTTTYSYQYNNIGYPVSATNSEGKTLTWTYDCQEF